MPRKCLDRFERLNDFELLIADLYLTALVICQGSRNFLRAWPFAERRTQAHPYHLVGERRVSTGSTTAWWPFAEPRHERTPFVIFSGLLGMTAVLASALASMPGHPEMLLSIPAYAIYLTVIFSLRARKLAVAG